MNEKKYTLFLPPLDLAKKPAKEWTRRDADVYLGWMLGCLDQRVTDFLQYVDVSADQTIESLLGRVGEKLESILQSSECFRDTEDGMRLSNLGYAIAADAGLLVAKCLIEYGGGKIFWKTLSKPKSAQSLNLPVLMGFCPKVELDPVAASIAQATGVLRGTEKKDRWLKLYEYWAAHT